jgi:hypothetical protein
MDARRPDRLGSRRAPGHRAGASPRLPAHPWDENFHDSTANGRACTWLWTGRSWSYHAERPAPGTEGGALAPDPLSGGMLYFSYTPEVSSYGPPPPDPTGTRYSQTWL